MYCKAFKEREEPYRVSVISTRTGGGLQRQYTLRVVKIEQKIRQHIQHLINTHVYCTYCLRKNILQLDRVVQHSLFPMLCTRVQEKSRNLWILFKIFLGEERALGIYHVVRPPLLFRQTLAARVLFCTSACMLLLSQPFGDAQY